MILYFDTKFDAQEKLLKKEIGNTNDRLDAIIKQNEIRNHRIETIEQETEVIDKKLSNGTLFCKMIQKQKEDRIIRNRWIMGIIVVLLCAYIGWFTKKSTEKIPIELFYQKTDSTFHVPRMYLRDKSGGLREVHVDYLNIKK